MSSRVVVALLVLLALQGLVSLATHRSLFSEVSARLSALHGHEAAAPPTGAEAAPQGPYAAHPDARVGRVLRASTELTLDGVALRSDELGLRARPGSAAPDAL